MNKEFVITKDGSHTIYLPEMDEHYHSTHGAMQESMHIYINEGLLQFSNSAISILEIGFGTGLNAFLTAIFGEKNNISVKYWSIEKYPLTETEYSKLNYASGEWQNHASIFEKIHRAPWNTDVEIEPGFTLHKIQADLTSYQFDIPTKVDLVYYDAFAPNKQPDLWTNEVIDSVSNCVNKNGILVTYCAKGSVRRAFASSGFQMERLPGPPGKKEIIRGKKLF
jgi:tRNA U34 5-methylaminomethyl-2-thiouridine-forming methyltransferase MnmC